MDRYTRTRQLLLQAERTDDEDNELARCFDKLPQEDFEELKKEIEQGGGAHPNTLLILRREKDRRWLERLP